MINIIAKNTSLLQKFLLRFAPVFSKKLFISFCTYLNGLLLEMKRYNIQSISAKAPQASYENIQYFLSDSKWDSEQFNSLRLRLLHSMRPTKSTRKGILALDDTGCAKSKTCKKTEGAKVQYFPTTGALAPCNIVVGSAYVDQSKRFPINIRHYLPDNEFKLGKDDPAFKSKIDLAIELVDDALANSISFSDVVFDNWYFCPKLVSHIESRGLTWVSEAAADDLISLHGKWTRADELAKLIPSSKFTMKVTATNRDGREKKFYCYSFLAKIRCLDRKVRIVVAKGSWDEDDPKNVRVFVTNRLGIDSSDVLRRWSLRWGIECIFREVKETVGFDHYQVHKSKAIVRHWQIALSAYSYLYWGKTNGYFASQALDAPPTLGEALTIHRGLNTVTSLEWIAENHEFYKRHLRLNKLPKIKICGTPKRIPA